MQDGERIVFRNSAHQLPGATTGDIIIIVGQKPHPVFQRKGSDLFAEKTISLAEALGGFTFDMTLPSGATVPISSSNDGNIVAHGDVKVLKGMGMPLRSNSSQRGNLYIKCTSLKGGVF